MSGSLASATSAVHRRVRELVPDVVHAHSSWAGVYARLFPVAVPVVYEPHCYKFDDGAAPPLLRLAFREVEQLLVSRTAITVVLSPHEDALAKGLSSEGHRVFVPNVASVTPGPRHPSTDFNIGERVIMIGRISRQKDPGYFARIARVVSRQWRDVEFVWIGDGRAADRRRLENSGVHVTGWLDESSLEVELSKPAVYLHTAAYEGFPLSILDAAAFEHPILARRIDAFNGLDLPFTADEDEAAAMIVDVLSRGDTFGRAVDAARMLNKSMNAASQAQALRSLYKPFREGA
jgi:glycosyltransferase involved in cell wall biosynthesis